MKKVKRWSWLLQPDEIATILNWRIRKVFDWLEDGRIGAERVEHNGRVRFYSSPISLVVWIREKQLNINRGGRAQLEGKAAAEKDYWDRFAHKQMVRSVELAEDRSRNKQ